jgi:hypothetical protein
MPNWSNIISGVGAFLDGASRVAVIYEWLKLSDESAFNSITEFVKGSSVESIDEIDKTLFVMAYTSIDPNTRARCVKFYTFFKLVEFIKFDKWRGFPRIT